jgi:hypothetical protein
VVAVEVPVARAAPRFAALRRLLEEECFVVLMLATMVAALARLLSSLVVQDTWLAFVNGRVVARDGIPQHDTLTVWTRGVRWIDQQWLAHLALYELARAGVVVAVAVAAGLAFLALAIAAVAARRAGASARSTAALLPVAIFCAPWMMQARSQSFALPLFVAVYALLAADSRRPARSVFLVVPLLVLWANLHGSVVLGAGLVVVHALLSARRGLARAALLAAAAVASVLATPYGEHIVSYYRWMLLESPLKDYVQEWQPTSPGFLTAFFYATSFVVVFLLARNGRVLSRFERVALPLLVLAGLLAVRNGSWLGLAFAASAPLLLDAEWTPATVLTPPLRRLNSILSTAAIAVAAIVVAATLARGSSALLGRWPAAAAEAVAAAAGPHGRVFSDDSHADWLLWERPELEGRVAYDVRFELFTRRQLQRLQAFRLPFGTRSPARGYRVFTFNRARDARRLGGPKEVVYRDSSFVVVARR